MRLIAKALSHDARMRITASCCLTCVSAWLEEIRLFHDAEELLLVHFAVTIAISLVDHLLELLVRHTFAKFLGDAFEVLETDFASFVVIEQTERFQNLPC